MISGSKSYSTVVSKKDVISVECQTTLTWVFSDRLLRTMQSSLHASGRPKLVSAGTQASSGKSGPASADARVPCEFVMGSEGSSAKGSASPSKTDTNGSAGPSKTAPLTDDASSSRVMPSKVVVDGVLVDVRGS